jgi:hypothetical protein
MQFRPARSTARIIALLGLLLLVITLRVRAQTSTPISVERVTLGPRGFEPRQLVRPAGRFLLALDNRTRLQLITIRLDAEQGGRLREIAMRRGKLKWRQLLDLPPGRYLLTEAGRPGWVCTITLTQR